MAFYEVAHGYVGLGSMEVYRTAEQAAADLKTFSHELPVPENAGLLVQQTVMDYAVSRGRLADLQGEVYRVREKLTNLTRLIEDKGNELESLGMGGAKDMALSAVKMGVKLIPGYGKLFAMFDMLLGMFGIDIFGGNAEKKRARAEQLIEEVKKLVEEASFWTARLKKLQAEGETLAAAFEKGEGAVSSVLINKEIDVKKHYTTYKDDKGMLTGAVKIEKKEHIRKDPYLQLSEELASRKTISTTGAKLPVGFQQIYSPALKNKSIIAQIEPPKASPEIVTGHKLVYGGLADLPLQDRVAPLIPLTMAFGGMLLFLNMLMDLDRQPLRVRQVYVPRRRF